ncbi:hypothetical protein FHS61_002647 [Altererythrobacter atlanticus]|uniref:Uncharacterized protein n=1 Tax=Croceibacterium atlanticum TaxID=1267766 RepID=A0A0F7KXJ4_9SPHN|nr:hypothetical protein [Croceibacterium atlanticum]AKH43946.1 hypothetical protein WYH_02919 [Croceibacterium atlanticum]MBB5733604.1 hypothetical protein [Croceibacterium atlanticum]
MYDYIDRPLEGLAERQRFLVWAMRLWVMSKHQARCSVRAVEPLFREKEAEGALGAFHCLMSVLARHTRCPLHFSAPCCPSVAEGEALLLTLIGAAGHVPPEDLAARCEGLIGDERAPELAFVVDRLAGALAEAD